MSKRQFKSQASSGRAGGGFGGFGASAFGTGSSSILSYVQEPPDYSSINDPNVVVAFKNLSKKDGTTKTKALEDLLAVVNQPDIEISDPFLEAWVKLFPRLSIDSVRRVRQLAESLNGHVSLKCGKRMVPHLSRIVGPWLAGTFDNDRTVAKAAVDALDLVFSSPEKVQGVRKTFQRSILEYCRNAALHETIQTLSDERVVSTEDAKAIYARVVATSLLLVGSLVRELASQDTDKEHQLYKEMLSDAKLWDMAFNPDAAVRRAMHRLVQTTLEKQPRLIQANLGAASTSYIYKGLHSDQTGSTLDFVQTLDGLTTTFPIVWTESYNGKRPAASRLRHFLKQGSQSGPPEFWESLSILFEKLPEQILPTDKEGITELLSSARAGVSKREERFNTSAAWPAYFTLLDIVVSAMPEDKAEPVLNEYIMPIIRQYLFAEPEPMQWNLPGAKAAWIVSRVASIRKVDALLDHEWPLLADRLVEIAKTSQPEQSKEFEKSQSHVAITGERWADLQRELFDGDYNLPTTLMATFASANTKILDECISLLKSRNGKPYGAASIIQDLLRTCGKYLMQVEAFKVSYYTFAETDLPALIFTPSQRNLLHGLFAAESDPLYSSAFAGLIKYILDADQPLETKVDALRTIFTNSLPKEGAKVARELPQLQHFLVQILASEASGGALFADMVRLHAVTEDTTDTVLSKLTESLSTADHSAESLSAIDTFSRTELDTIRNFITKASKAGEQLLPSILRLEQSPDDAIAVQASTVSYRLSSSFGQATSTARYAVVLQSLKEVNETSLSMDAVHDLTSRVMGGGGNIDDALEVLPSLDLWRSTLLATLQPPKHSLALLSPLGGVVYNVHFDSTSSYPPVQYDKEGFSQALRISMHVSKLLAETELLQGLGDRKEIVLALMHLSVLVAEDNLSVPEVNSLWKATGSEEDTVMLDFITEANDVLSSYWKSVATDKNSSGLSQFDSALQYLRNSSDDSSPLSYYVTLSSTQAHDNYFELHGFSSEVAKTAETLLREQRSSGNHIAVISCIAGFHQPLSGSPFLTRYCNELVADLTAFSITKNEDEGLKKLILLNAILRTQEDAVAGIAKQRIIFLVKHMLPWLSEDIFTLTKAEVCKGLAELLPGIDDMYGEHWVQALSFLLGLWTTSEKAEENGTIREDYVVLQNYSLRLLITLQRLAKSDEANDDLVDALNDKRKELHDGLVNLLILANGINDETHQPLMIVHELLARQVASLPYQSMQVLDELYPLIYTPSKPIQHVAFELLHKQIPAAQEQISFDAALDNKTAQLPDELLSLILEAPTLDSLADASFEGTMPLSLQGYLFSWRLVFDHFQGSSYRVKSDYIEQLKDGAYLPGLLRLMFDFLGHTRGRPVDVSKFDIENYVPDTELDPEKDVQWLLTHLYFLALTHLPSLVKSYYLEIRSRQTSQAVETWTAKHISPLIINASLQAVIEWAEKSVQEDPEYEKMTIKVSMKSKEINVSYEVDEQIMAMKVELPDAFPLTAAKVVGVNRVAVKEEKWNSWLRNCQGVIQFSNGSITDGLSAWRKNVTGAMKGQTECAICYSIISADKQLPSKKCPTCKNLFHSSCLLKWFRTSNESKCPLCRNSFNFY